MYTMRKITLRTRTHTHTQTYAKPTHALYLHTLTQRGGGVGRHCGRTTRDDDATTTTTATGGQQTTATDEHKIQTDRLSEIAGSNKRLREAERMNCGAGLCDAFIAFE